MQFNQSRYVTLNLLNFYLTVTIIHVDQPKVELNIKIYQSKKLNHIYSIHILTFIQSNEVVNLTSEKHDPCAQKSPTQKKKTRIPCRRHWCGADQIPSEGQVRNILATLEC